jgi:Lon protease-like protein
MKISFGNMRMELHIFDINNQSLKYDEVESVCLIEEIKKDTVDESSIEDPLEACLAQFGEDLDLDKLLEQADAILESAPLVSSEKEKINEGPLEACLAQFGEDLDLDKLLEQADAILESTSLVNSEKEETVVPEPLKKELEPLLDKLTYKFLGLVNSLPVIIAPDLVDAQEEKSLDVLKKYKEGIS